MLAPPRRLFFAEDGFFRMLERQVYALWGVEPRCWHEPGVGWEEEVRDS